MTQLEAEFGGDIDFEYNHEVYWKNEMEQWKILFGDRLTTPGNTPDGNNNNTNTNNNTTTKGEGGGDKKSKKKKKKSKKKKQPKE